MSENITVYDTITQSDDVRLKLEKAIAIISTLQNGIFDFPEVDSDILTDNGEQAHANMQHILLQYNDSKLFIDILLDYVSDSRDLIRKLSSDLSKIDKTLRTINSVYITEK